jgi:hypothetical protein
MSENDEKDTRPNILLTKKLKRYEKPELLASYNKQELEAVMQPKGQDGGGCGCSCGCGS